MYIYVQLNTHRLILHNAEFLSAINRYSYLRLLAYRLFLISFEPWLNPYFSLIPLFSSFFFAFGPNLLSSLDLLSVRCCSLYF
jgi:hypothetical protein